VGEHERSDGWSTHDVEQGRVTALVRGEIVAGETNPICSTVAVDGKVGEALVRAVKDTVPYELCREHAVAALTRNVINAVSGEMQFPRQEPSTAGCLCHAGSDHRSVLIPIPWE
jgi:hypothetical protein